VDGCIPHFAVLGAVEKQCEHRRFVERSDEKSLFSLAFGGRGIPRCARNDKKKMFLNVRT